jgi:hypothetical protein
MRRALRMTALLNFALVVASPAKGQDVSTSGTFDQFINSPPELVLESPDVVEIR